MVRFTSLFSEFDQFGGSIPLNIKGRETLQTGRGSLITLLVFILFSI